MKPYSERGSEGVFPIFKKLIEMDTSVSQHADETRSTTAAADEVGKWLKESGAEVHYTDEMEYPKGSGKKHKGLVAVFYPDSWDKSAPNQDALAFSAHIDVVPAHQDDWKSDPFALSDTGEKLIGRGAVDIKGPLASVIYCMQQAKEEIKKGGNKPVMLMLSSCEEVGAEGAQLVCKTAKDLNLFPSEVVVVEPTDGMLGLGCKGAVESSIKFVAPRSANASLPPYDKAMKITIENQGGHASLLGASSVDPAKTTLAVYDAVKALRERGYNLEICDAKIGSATNVIAARSELTIGYYGTNEDAKVIREELHKAAHEIQDKANSDMGTFIAKVIAGDGMIARKRHMNFGLDFGKIALTADDLDLSGKEKLPATASGHVNALETALDAAKEIYARHKEYRKKGIKPADNYFISALGYPGMIVSGINGDSSNATLSNDNRSTELVGNEELKDNIHKIIEKVKEEASKKGNILIEPDISTSLPGFAANAQRHQKAIDGYIELMEKTGFSHLKWKSSKMPYSSDGGFIQEAFPHALVITAAQGGLRNKPHAKHEYTERQDLDKNVRLYSAIISQKVLRQEVERMAAVAR